MTTRAGGDGNGTASANAPGSAREDGFAEPSLPRSNGAPVFEAPWQARAHAMAVLVVERSGQDWGDFRRFLVDAVGDAGRPYWDSWVVALDRFVDDAGLLD